MAHPIRTILTISLHLLLGFSLFTSGSAYAQQPELGKITLIGRGEIKAMPDEAHVMLSLVTQSKTAAEALRKNSADMNDAVAAVKAAGIDGKDIQTAHLNISPQYVHVQNAPPRLSGYEARNSIAVTIKDLGKLGALLDRVVELGINDVKGPVFGLKEKDAMQDRARLLAIEDVKKRAALYQKGLGVKLGRMLQIYESEQAPQPAMFDIASAEMRQARSTPIEAGELSIVSQITVVWEILP